MMRFFTVLTVCMAFSASAALAQTSLEGKVTEQDNGDPVIFGTVSLFKNGVLITGTETDFDGNYAFSNIDPGTYDVEASYVGFTAQRQVGVVVLAGKAIRLDFQLSSGVVLTEVEIFDYKVPLIEQDNTTQGGIKTAEQIRNLPTKDINALAATTAGLSSIDGGDIAIRGSRTDATNYYVDGVRVSGNLIPQSEIEQLQVITGGIEAQYGDVTGGIISLTTKGPSQAFSGGLEIETSEFLDPYGYNLISANLSGPILKNSKGNSVVGFRVSGQFKDVQDDNPRAFGFYRATENVIDQIEADPLQLQFGSPRNVAETLTINDVVLDKAAPNEQQTSYDFTGRLDARLSQFVDFTVSGSYNQVEDRFSQGQGLGRSWGLLNWRNNPIDNNDIYRINVRLRHRLGGGPSGDPESAAGKAAVIRNASYALQFGYQKASQTFHDIRHADRFFDYGYVGDFENNWIPAVGESEYSGGFPVQTPGGFIRIAHAGYVQQFNGWTPGTINPARANYNKLLEDVPAMNQFNAFNSFLSSSYNETWGGLHQNVGGIYNRYQKSQGERYTFNVTSGFDLFPGGSDKGRHSLQFGILYEQRIGRLWTIVPYRLWEIARSYANGHILGVDTNNIIGSFYDSTFMMEFDQFQTLINNEVLQDADVQFFKEVRELTGQTVYDYVNIDGISPDQLSLDLFSPQELNDQQLINYYGYDYLGNPISNSTTFEDFFTDIDENGQRRFTVAPNKPIYTSAYIQDKFTFKDIIFRLGLRVDRFDANNKILKDPYTLYEIMDAGDFYAGPGSGEQIFGEDDWKVYVESDGSTNVKAFRDGDQWYNETGSPVNSGNAIFAGQLVHPYYVEQDIERRNIRSRDFDPNTIFEDYTPQVSWMPRLAFSFPISDEANFFMHYDILVQRPPSNNLATALDYYYFEDTQPRNNPNLKPERTVDWEAGFKQKLTNSSALTISAYVKELRDMIQSRFLLNLPPPINQYETIGNLDFGTVKGLSFSYDLRRTNNLELTASYTLQFADGTGSTVDSQRDIARNGNLRQLIPLNFDERHRVVALLDYRYDSGKRYNGPRLFGADIFSNTGANLQVTTVSGRPYTKQQNPTRFGGTGFLGAINGARYPWNITLDLRVNKQFRLTPGESEKNPIFFDVYFRVQNLLDTRNVIGVYRSSGSAEDDGYLASSFGQDELRNL
ncbi:MAG TPA: TonB-dependent receptor, partial [Saprospiraceae bacterium]|nr:TonB-dependent receptor [Saprospiraceae bacterium]